MFPWSSNREIWCSPLWIRQQHSSFEHSGFLRHSSFELRHFSALPSEQDENASEQSQNAHYHNVNDDCMEDRSDAIKD
jgi:hypothetical protein